MSDIFPDSDGTLSLCHLDASWARRATDFDARVFRGEAWPFEAWQEMLSNPELNFFAYVRAPEGLQARGDVVALGGISSGDEPEIVTLGVERAYRNHGLGGKLLDLLISQAKKNVRATHITLEVRSDNEQALALYTSRGFTPCVISRGDDEAISSPNTVIQESEVAALATLARNDGGRVKQGIRKGHFPLIKKL